MDLQTQIETGNTIRQLQNLGKFDEALSLCQTLIGRFPEQLFYRRIEEKLLAKKSVEKSNSSLARSWKAHLQKNDADEALVKLTLALDVRSPNELWMLLNQAFYDSELLWKNAYRAMHFSVYFEKYKQYDQAIKLLQEVIAVHRNRPAIQALFRLSRLQGDYSAAERILATYPDIQASDNFHIGYELVHYFEKSRQHDQIPFTLENMERASQHNPSFQNALYNLYRHLGMLDKGQQFQNQLPIVQKENREPVFQVNQNLEDPYWHKPSPISTTKEDSPASDSDPHIVAFRDLTQGIAHEFGQPLTNIRFSIQMQQKKLAMQQQNLQGHSELLTQLNDTFESILEETERMGRLNQRLAPITSAKKVLESCNLVAQIQRIIAMNQERLKNPLIKVTVIPEKPIMLYTDPLMFDQIINNLLFNAVDAIHQHHNNIQHQISFSLHKENKRVTLVCVDTGVGIPEKHFNRLFDPFFTTKSAGKGEGLGLFIIWNLLKANGGTIALDPFRTEGACFTITVPESKP